jgi:hypothetical protein
MSLTEALLALCCVLSLIAALFALFAYLAGRQAFNRIGMNRTNNILLLSVVNGGVWIASLGQAVIANPLIRAEQADLMRHGFVNERLQS